MGPSINSKTHVRVRSDDEGRFINDLNGCINQHTYLGTLKAGHTNDAKLIEQSSFIIVVMTYNTIDLLAFSL